MGVTVETTIVHAAKVNVKGQELSVLGENEEDVFKTNLKLAIKKLLEPIQESTTDQRDNCEEKMERKEEKTERNEERERKKEETKKAEERERKEGETKRTEEKERKVGETKRTEEKERKVGETKRAEERETNVEETKRTEEGERKEEKTERTRGDDTERMEVKTERSEEEEGDEEEEDCNVMAEGMVTCLLMGTIHIPNPGRHIKRPIEKKLKSMGNAMAVVLEKGVENFPQTSSITILQRDELFGGIIGGHQTFKPLKDMPWIEEQRRKAPKGFYCAVVVTPCFVPENECVSVYEMQNIMQRSIDELWDTFGDHVTMLQGLLGWGKGVLHLQLSDNLAKNFSQRHNPPEATEQPAPRSVWNRLRSWTSKRLRLLWESLNGGELMKWE